MLDYGFYNIDCMVGMAEFPNNYFDLAIVDPPYGIGYDTKAVANNGKRNGTAKAPKRVYHGGGWDIRPSKDYFDELLRVSKNQIVWGGGIILQIICHHQKVLYVGIRDATTILQTHLQTVRSHGSVMAWVLQGSLGIYGTACYKVICKTKSKDCIQRKSQLRFTSGY